MAKVTETRTRALTARAFTAVEDVVYLGLGVLLAGSALALLISSGITFAHDLWASSLTTNIVPLLDRLLLILLVVELLYTVQVSFREHGIIPEPFLLVGIIAGIRRVLVLTAEFSEVKDQTEGVFKHLIIELTVLTFLIVAMVISLVLLRKRGVTAVAERAT
ncbi:MAG: phosphate-starvation-inducible PsiE family protein [Acidobacteriota bacterium]